MKLNDTDHNISLVINVTLNNFRNFEYCNVYLKQYNVLFGNNGSGKTNFLESLSLLSPGKGLRGVQFEELLNKKNNNLKANFIISSDVGTNSFSLFKENYPPNSVVNSVFKKTFLLDGSPFKKLQDILFYIRPLWIIPKMDILFLEDTTTQRNFFDRLIFNLDSSHLTRINAYNKALKERNALLKNNSKNSSWFKALEDILATHAVAIAASRIDFIEQMNIFLKNQSNNFFSKIVLQTDGVIENFLLKGNISALTCENLIKEKLQHYRSEDFKTGTTSLGIHKSNIIVLNLKNNLYAKQCSTGEQKMILFTIIISFVKLVMCNSPNNILLLLDEFLVHLDKYSRNSLLEELTNLPLQFIITSTEINNFASYKNKINFLEVKDNNIFQL